MNGAAVNCQQEQALHPQQNDSSSLQSLGYLLQTKHPCQEKNSQQQYSKAMNYNSLPDNFSVDGSSTYSEYIDSYSSETRNRLSISADIWKDRINSTRFFVREPMELPVPNFEIDENSVGVFKYKKDESSSAQDSKDLDLDARIDLLIKSKALSGMHPIFSDLNESEDSSTDSEELHSDLSIYKHTKPVKMSFPNKHVVHQESFDDPEKPLSRPPSPFLSRATYLFWFNKAIELKQQAKAQEKALLEKATKKLSQGNFTSGKESKTTSSSKQDSNLINNLLIEVSKELKEFVKQDFIKEIIESTVLNSLEDWWVNGKELEKDNFSKDLSVDSSSTIYNVQSKQRETNEPAKFQARKDSNVSQDQKSTSLKLQFPLNENENQKSKEKVNIFENSVRPTTSIIDLNKTLVIKSDTDVLEGLTAEHESVLCEENVFKETKSMNDSCTVDGFSLRKCNPLDQEVVGLHDTFSRNANGSNNNEFFKEKYNGVLWKNAKNELKAPVDTEYTNDNSHCLTKDNLQIPGIIQPLNENILVERGQSKLSENSTVGNIETQKLDNLEENSRVSSKNLPEEQINKEEGFHQDLYKDKQC